MVVSGCSLVGEFSGSGPREESWPPRPAGAPGEARDARGTGSSPGRVGRKRVVAGRGRIIGGRDGARVVEKILQVGSGHQVNPEFRPAGPGKTRGRFRGPFPPGGVTARSPVPSVPSKRPPPSPRAEATVGGGGGARDLAAARVAGQQAGPPSAAGRSTWRPLGSREGRSTPRSILRVDLTAVRLSEVPKRAAASCVAGLEFQEVGRFSS